MSVITLYKNTTTPPLPDVDHYSLYFNEDGKLFLIDSEGVKKNLSDTDAALWEVSGSLIHPTGGLQISVSDIFNLQDILDGKSSVNHVHKWSDITSGVPTTLAGYGITDAYTNSEVDALLSGSGSTTPDWTDILNTPTTISGYGITDAYTKTEVNNLLPTDFYTQLQIDNLLLGKADSVHAHEWTDILNTPTTISGYGITDGYTKTQVDALLPTDFYSQSAIDIMLGNYQETADKNIASGYAGLDSNAKIPLSLLPDTSKQQTYVVLDATERNALVDMIEGDKSFETSTGDSHIWDGSSWVIMADADWENVNIEWTNIIGTPTTLAGYGITNAYTKTEVDALIPTDFYTQLQINDLLNGKADTSHVHSWSDITTGVPTTISGYGITDAYTKTEVDNLLPTDFYTQLQIDNLLSGKSDTGHVHDWTDITTGVPTTISGYEITDAYTKNEVDTLIPTDFYSQSTIDTLLSGKSDTTHVHDWTDITTGVPTTIAGYGITDAYTKLEVDDLITDPAWADITGTPTTLSGYGITDTYTKTQVDTEISSAVSGIGGTSQTVSELSNIIGETSIDISNDSYITGNMTGSVTLSFTNPPASGTIKYFILAFTRTSTSYEITWPTGTMFAGGVAPTIVGLKFEVSCMINASGDLTVYGIVDDIA